jgi:hypothetical protein
MSANISAMVKQAAGILFDKSFLCNFFHSFSQIIFHHNPDSSQYQQWLQQFNQKNIYQDNSFDFFSTLTHFGTSFLEVHAKLLNHTILLTFNNNFYGNQKTKRQTKFCFQPLWNWELQ